MTDERMERDTELGALLRDACGAVPAEDVDWAALQSRISARTAPVLARQRQQQRSGRRRFYVPATLAASFLLFVLLARGSGPGPAEHGSVASAGAVSIEAMFDADVSDGQFRALLAGAAELEDLLLLAATGGDIQ